MKRIALGVALLGAMLPCAGRAQTAVQVTDDTDESLPGTVVEIWGESSRLLSATTDSSGSALVPLPEEATGAFAARPGYQSATVDLTGRPLSIVIELRRDPVPLPTLVIESGLTCPAEDQPEARVVWLAARTHHSDLTSQAVQARLWFAEETIPAARVGVPPMEVMRGPVSMGTSARHRGEWTERIARSGYAVRLGQSSLFNPAYEAWEYAPLGADLAHHLADPLFGELYTFTLVTHDDAGWLVAFCPLHTDRPEITGTIEISPDYAILAGQWRFLVPEFDETAGGRATFAVSRPGTLAVPLLPVDALYWREAGPDIFYQRYRKYDEWEISTELKASSP